MSSSNEFEKGDAGSSTTLSCTFDHTTHLVEAGRAKPGSLIMLKETFPCKVTQFATAKPGKHGSAKAMITGKDIFTDKQYEETFGTGDMTPAPTVAKNEYNCIAVDGDFLQLMAESGELKEDIKLPSEEHLKDIKKGIERILDEGKKECLVQVQTWGDREQAVGVREGQEQ